MGSTHLPRLRRTASDAERWSFAAFVLATVGLALSLWVILASDGDSSHVRWWLVALPLLATAASIVLPSRRIRLASAVGLGTWCVLASASIGMFLLPALCAAIGAVVRDEP